MGNKNVTSYLHPKNKEETNYGLQFNDPSRQDLNTKNAIFLAR